VIPTILGGIGLFLLGMILMTEGLKAAAGDALRRLLQRLTGGPLRAMVSGATMTMLVQSSSATTLATIGFVSAGLLTFPQAIGLIFGANLGTTSTGWIVSLLGLKLKMGAVALPLVGVGALARLLLRGRASALGLALAGFGLIFVGIDTLTDGMATLAGRIDPASLPGGTFLGRLLLVGVGAVMAVVMQSSSAAVATTLAALHTGAIGLPDAAALVIGQNVGTTVTAAIAQIGASVPARRTALAHILFNLLTGAVALAILPLFLRLVNLVSRELDITGDAATLAAFHTAFNLLGVLLLLPFTRPFARMITRWVPDRGPQLTRLLDPSVAAIAPVAVDTARRTAVEIAALVLDVVRAAVRGRPRPDAADALAAAEQAVEATRGFLHDVRTSPDAGADHARHLAVLHALDHLDRLTVAAAETRHAPAMALPGAGEWAGRVDALLGDAIAWLADPEVPPPVRELEEGSLRLADFRRGHRRELLRRTAVGEATPTDADRELDAMRWLDRLAYHLWRAMHHLGSGSPVPDVHSEVADEPERGGRL
jgi:phosphate:Na+ symporter